MNLGDDHSEEDVLKEHTLRLLRRHNNNRTVVARIMGCSRQTVTNRLNDWGVKQVWTDSDSPDSEPRKS